MTTKILLHLVLPMVFCGPALAQSKAPAGQARASQGFAVVELFTSQGCSSCPAADRLLSEIIADAAATGKKVYAMSFHVDYWNKLGWKDPYSKFAFTNRQNNYVSALGGKEVYTPQVFVNGKIGLLGSDKQNLMKERDKALALPPEMSLSVRKDSLLRDSLFISYAASGSGANFSFVVALVQRGIETQVSQGENKGKKLRHDNVVRVFRIVPLTSPSGQAALPIGKIALNRNFSVFAYVQQKQTKHILAATGITF